MIRTKQVILLHLNIPIMVPGGILQVSLDKDDGLEDVLERINMSTDKAVFVAFKDNPAINNNLIGVYGTILSSSHQDETVELIIQLQSRAVINNFSVGQEYYLAEIYECEPLLTEEQTGLYNIIKNKIFQHGSAIVKDFSAVSQAIDGAVAPELAIDMIVASIFVTEVDQTEFLNELNFTARLTKLAQILDLVAQQLQLDNDIEMKVHQELEKEQKEYYLRKKLRLVQEELGDIDKVSDDADDLKEKIENAGMPETAKKQVLKELKRYKTTNSASPESTMIRAYLDTMLELPWTKETEDNLDINAAKAKLDETHFGLEKVKDRILEYLSVKLYTSKNPQTIICFAGPPGVGKTTLAKSIAEALGRKFVKQSLGGIQDEAEIRGHRRTYIGALPGRIINGIKEAGVINPVFLLDEIDKVGSNYKGDPNAALLEVLDPAQNAHFMDHYTEVEYDLSKVIFICTANELDKIPGPLRDRMEIIELSSYTELEKFEIAKNYVIKRSLDKNGLEPEKITITDDAIKHVIKYYTREAGARQLERNIDSLVRKAIKKILSDKVENVYIDEKVVEEMLGKKLYDYNEANKEDLVGVVNGLAYTQAGGDVLQIETLAHAGKEGNLVLTGNLGDVMKESATIAHNWIRVNGEKYNAKATCVDLYVHCPEGAVPKDGPSAGVTFTTSMISALSNKKVRHDLAMTGEISLSGRVLPIGGLREKSIAAYRCGIKEILIPNDNIKDLDDIPQEVKDNLVITPIMTIDEVLSKALI